ncbi:MAG: hypothetical protein ACOCXM_08625 [Myxococcota bacterium]
MMLRGSLSARFVAVVCALCIGSSTPLAADDAPDAPDAPDATIAQARELFQEGLGYVDREAWPRAARRFEQVLDLRWSANVAYNLALVRIELGQPAEAAALLRRALADESLPPKVRPAAENKLDEVTARLAHVTIDLTGAEEGTVVLLDGRVVRPRYWGTPLGVDPGTHHVVLLRHGRVATEKRVHVDESQRIRAQFAVAPTPEEAAHAAVADPETPRVKRQRRVMVATGVLSAVATVTTVILTAIVLARQ